MDTTFPEHLHEQPALFPFTFVLMFIIITFLFTRISCFLQIAPVKLNSPQGAKSRTTVSTDLLVICIQLSNTPESPRSLKEVLKTQVAIFYTCLNLKDVPHKHPVKGIYLAKGPNCHALKSTPKCASWSLSTGCSQPMPKSHRDTRAPFRETWSSSNGRSWLEDSPVSLPRCP